MSRRTKALVMAATNGALFALSLSSGFATWAQVALGVLFVPTLVWAVIETREARRGSAEG